MSGRPKPEVLVRTNSVQQSRRNPRISLSKFGEHLSASAQSWAMILRGQKYPGLRVVDVLRGSVFEAPGAVRSRLREIEAGCEEIAEGLSSL